MERLWDQFSVPLLPGGLVNFLPNLAITLALGMIIGAWAAPRLGLSRRATGALWLACLLVPLAYTLSATRNAGLAGCEVGLAPWESRTALFSTETRANVAMLTPAGAAALLFPSGPRRLAALGAALALSPAIEVTQMVVRPLGRACQGADVFNNTLGVLLGFWLAAGVWVLWTALASGNPGPKHAAGSRPGSVVPAHTATVWHHPASLHLPTVSDESTGARQSATSSRTQPRAHTSTRNDGGS